MNINIGDRKHLDYKTALMAVISPFFLLFCIIGGIAVCGRAQQHLTALRVCTERRGVNA